MIGTRMFGAVLLIIGGFLAYGLISSSLPIILGKKTKATIVAVEQVESKRFTYLYYPVFQFTQNDKLVKILDKSSDINKEKVYTQTNIYYNEKYGISRGFTAVDIIFAVISICFIFFGLKVFF